jgi:hypothetical protein
MGISIVDHNLWLRFRDCCGFFPVTWVMPWELVDYLYILLVILKKNSKYYYLCSLICGTG